MTVNRGIKSRSNNNKYTQLGMFGLSSGKSMKRQLKTLANRSLDKH